MIGVACSLFGLVATHCDIFLRVFSCSLSYLIVLFSGSCLALWLSCLERGSWLLHLSLVCGLCSVCHHIENRKQAYSNISKISQKKKKKKKKKNWKFSDSDIFHISARNIDCGYSLEPPQRDGSNEYPQSMFWAEIRKINYTPLNPSFTI